METKLLEGIDVARAAVDIAGEKQAANIVLLDAREVCSFADYFVICSGDNERQLGTIYDEIELNLKRHGVVPHHHEGTIDSGWMLLDYGDVIIHIFGTRQRDFFNLDELWHEARTVLRIQ